MDAIKVDREILGGTPCFAGTRVPVKSLFDYLEDGYNIDSFLGQFPAVKREQVLSVLESSRRRTEAHAKSLAS
ncbi:MAG: DUF433 domain-containing protein [Tepidisphaeraceae bacterium]|jgi:uncharacterized protein (DUF433 family)